MRIVHLNIPGDDNGRLERFVLTQVELCMKELLKIPTNDLELAQALYTGQIAKTILICLAEARP